MGDVNGAVKEILGEGATVGNPEVARVLEAVLREARAGRVLSVGVVAVMGTGQVSVSATRQHSPSDLYFGAGLLMDLVMEQVAQHRGRRSSILVGR
jgi:hypothetical protein